VISFNLTRVLLPHITITDGGDYRHSMIKFHAFSIALLMNNNLGFIISNIDTILDMANPKLNAKCPYNFMEHTLCKLFCRNNLIFVTLKRLELVKTSVAHKNILLQRRIKSFIIFKRETK
jgi:hypothetical protein